MQGWPVRYGFTICSFILYSAEFDGFFFVAEGNRRPMQCVTSILPSLSRLFHFTKVWLCTSFHIIFGSDWIHLCIHVVFISVLQGQYDKLLKQEKFLWSGIRKGNCAQRRDLGFRVGFRSCIPNAFRGMPVTTSVIIDDRVAGLPLFPKAYSVRMSANIYFVFKQIIWWNFKINIKI